MLTQPFLRTLIVSATGIWQIPPPSIYRASNQLARQARIAVFHSAYLNGCSQRDLVVAFGWSGTGRRNLTPHEVRRAHELYRVIDLYTTRFGKLEQRVAGLVPRGDSADGNGPLHFPLAFA